MDDRSEGVLIEMDRARHQTQKIINDSQPLRRRVTIDILPGDVLLVIFDHYVAIADEDRKYEEWHVLVHVCQKWRYVVFRSPLRLNLRIFCSAGAPVREKLAVWPPFPIIIEHSSVSISKCDKDNIIAALGHNDRVCAISLAVSSSLLERVLAAMRKTFVALKELYLSAMGDRALVISDSFLGRSAPHLRRLCLIRIRFPFPVLRKLPLYAPNLVNLELDKIPHSGYISPEEMVTCLSVLTGLENICVGFESFQSRPPQEGRHPPPTRSVFPALTKLTYAGVSEYLEDLVARIDAPLLNRLRISFFYETIFNIPQFAQFLSRTPKLKPYDESRVILSNSDVTIVLPGRDYLELQLRISCGWLDWQLPCLTQVCTSSFPQALITMVEHLYILKHVSLGLPLEGDWENKHWLELFRAFTPVKNLYLSREFVPYIAPTLQELVGDRLTEVLPNLQNIFLEDVLESGFVPEAMRQFIAARQLSSCPIAISTWIRQKDMA